MRPPLPNTRAWAAINLSALERNLRSIRLALPQHLKYISVVKANAYGHGLAPTVTRLMRANTDAFAVANLDEAKSIQEVGSGWPILILSALLPDEFEAAAYQNVIPVLSSAREIRAFNKAAASTGSTRRYHLKIDTGMGRLGIWHDDIQEIIGAVHEAASARLHGLCTHFSSADSDPDFTASQRQRFLKAANLLANRCPDIQLSTPPDGFLVHADNSAGLDSFPAAGPFNAARIGLLQFGISPHRSSLLNQVPVEPTLSFHTRVGLVKTLPAQTPISYGQTFRTSKPTTIAILTAGYADGLPTSLSNKGSVIVHGKRCPIIGRVTMDQTIIDVSHLPNKPLPGDTASFISQLANQNLQVSNLAQTAAKIEWEILTGISTRTTRVYITDSAT